MTNNLSQLLDLAINQGFSRSSLMAEIKQAILAKYREQNPQASIGMAVLIDEETGLIKIFSGDKEVGSEQFSQESIQLAQNILINKIAQTQAVGNYQGTQQINSENKPKKTGSGIFGKILFWIYNIYFIFFNFSFALSFFLGENLLTTIKNIEWTQALVFTGIFLLPIVTITFVLRKNSQHQNPNLMKLFFFFELPLAVLLLLSSSLIGRTTAFTALSLLTVLAIPLLLYIHFAKIELSTLGKQILAFLSQFATILVGYYVLLFSFIFPLIVIGLPKTYLFDSFFYYGHQEIYSPATFVQLAFALLFFLMILALTALPYLLLRTLWKITEKNRLDLIKGLGEKQAEKHFSIGWIVVLLLFAISLFKWSDHRLLTQLNNFNQKADYSTQEASATPLIKEEAKLQRLVQRKIEARSYYLFDKDSNYLAYFYEDIFGNETFGEIVQNAFTHLAYPLVHWEEGENQKTLASNYQYLFGYPYYLSQIEKEKIAQEEEVKSVLLTYRQITVDTEADGLLAKITIEEEYDNQTNQEQEIIYEFNLPDEAAFFDLNLGPNLEFPGIIAPKGAAQKVYERELQQRRDPALLEQTGPNQYRLRIYPIPGKNDFTTLEGQRQKVSFTYSVAQSNGVFALPHYTREGNVFLDASSSVTLSYNDQINYLEETKNLLTVVGEDTWNLCQEQDRVFSISEAERTANLIFHANDADLQKVACGETSEILPLLKNYRLAIVYDSSFNNQDSQVLKEFTKLLENSDAGWLDETQVNLYKFNQIISQGEKLTSDNFKDLLEPIYFSKANDFSKLGEITGSYDLIVLITSQDISFAQLNNFPFSKPSTVYWVSEEKLPALNMEMASGLWQTGGGASTSVEEAMRQFLIKEKLAEKYGDSTIALNQKLSLSYEGLSGNLANNIFNENTALAVISNKGLLNKFVSQQDREVVGDINLLDQLDNAARQANLVSPYSSSIALINEQQIEALKQLMEQYNRFQDTQMIENVTFEPRSPVWDPVMPRMESSRPPAFFMKTDDFSSGEMLMRQAPPDTGFQSIDLSPSFVSRSDIFSLGAAKSSDSSSSWIFSANSGVFIISSGLMAGVGLVVYLIQQLRRKRD